MAFNIDPNIPLQAKTTFDPAAIIMQAQQGAAALERHRFEMQKLREEYDTAKEVRAQQKRMQQGIANDLQKIRSGSPAQYAPLQYQQTPQTGQMPFGMTGVLASEAGKNTPQPQVFGQDLLSGNYNVSHPIVKQAIAGAEPSYADQLQIAVKNALAVGDVDSAFKYSQALQQQRVAEREQNAPVGNPYPIYDAQGNFVGTRIMTKAGQELPFGAAGTTTVKPDVLTAKDKAQMAFELKKQDRQLAAQAASDERKARLEPAKGDPVERALAIAQGKEDIKQKAAIEAARKEKMTNANEGLPLIDNYIQALKESPGSGLGESYQEIAGYLGMGDERKQAGMAKAKQAGEALVTFAQKQPGPSTDRDVQSYRAQMGVVTDKTLPAASRIAAAEQAKSLLLKIQAKYGDYNGAAEPVKPVNHGDIVNDLPATAPKGAVAKNLETGKPEYIFNGVKWIPFGRAK